MSCPTVCSINVKKTNQKQSIQIKKTQWITFITYKLVTVLHKIIKSPKIKIES